MIDLEVNYNKINKYLSSFIADEKSVPGRPLGSNGKSVSTSLYTLPSENVLAVKNKKTIIQNYDTERTKTLPKNCQDFKTRLSTFEFGLWTCTEISPLVCASYGWKLSEKDILYCVTCKAVVCYSLPLPNQLEAYSNFTKNLRERLITGHKDWCGWPSNPSPSEFLHPPLYITVHYLKNLIDIAIKIVSLGANLPYINSESLLKKLDLEEQDVAVLYEKRENLDKTHIIAAILVLFGWEFKSSEKLHCSLCLRNVGLWNFLPLKKEEEYLSLCKKNADKQEKKRRIEARRKEKERRNLIKEEERKAEIEKERKELEEQKRKEEEALKVKRALEKISRIEKEDYSSEADEGDESEEEMGEEEENILLSEDNREIGKETEEESQLSLAKEEEASEHETVNDKSPSDHHSADSDIKDDEPSSLNYPNGDKSVCNSEEAHSDHDSDEDIDQDYENDGSVDLYNEEEDEEEQPHSEDEEELWLEAVGGCGVDTPASPSSSEECQDDLSSDDASVKHSRKRQRSSDDESEAEDIAEPAVKCPRLSDDIIESEEENDAESVEDNDGEKDDNNNTEEEEEETMECETESSEEEDEPNKEDNLYDEMKNSIFDPLGQHRHWCGWIADCTSLDIEENPTDTPGYKIIPPQLKIIIPELSSTSSLATSEKYARNIEGLRTVRHILDSWAIPEDTDE